MPQNYAVLFNRIAAVFSFAANLAVVIGLPIALLTYIESLDDNRRSKSLEYISDFRNDPVISSRNVIYRVWKSFDRETLGPSLTRKLLDAYVARVNEKNESEGPEYDIRTAIVAVADYFDGVEACIDAGVCDAAILIDSVGSYALAFRCLYESELRSMRENHYLGSLGQGLFEFSERLGDCDP